MGVKAKKCLDALEKEFPSARPALDFTTPLELLMATMLSAQATDKSVNKVTPRLFTRFKSVKDFAKAELKDIESVVSSINFYRNKAKNIKACSEKIIAEFGGKVPATLEGLVSLPGVGRKTANIVLGNAFSKDAFAVDTHVKRVSQRLGLSTHDDPDKVEADLCSVIPKKRWTKATQLFMLHGRQTCAAKKPHCALCRISRYCGYFKTVCST
ncbi:endonuclease III [bacterium]|nr:MAG: endonuclease III [bacterium]